MAPETYDATIRLGIVLSTIAAVTAVVLSLAGDVSRWSLVASVAITGVIASWVQSGHTMHAAAGSGMPPTTDPILADPRATRSRAAESPAAHPFG